MWNPGPAVWQVSARGPALAKTRLLSATHPGKLNLDEGSRLVYDSDCVVAVEYSLYIGLNVT